MDASDRHVIKTALRTLQGAGGAGVKKSALLDQIDLAAGTPTTDEQRETAFQMLKDRGWITFFVDPVWRDQRWVLTDRGYTALEGM